MAQPNPHSRFVDALVADLAPVEHVPSLARETTTLSLFAWLVVGALIVMSGPLRPGAIDALGTAPRYLLEFALGMSTALAALIAGLEFGVPGQNSAISATAAAIALSLGWFGLLVYGLVDPALSTGVLGRRPLCFLETVAFAIAPIAIFVRALKRRALYSPGTAGIFFGLSGASISAAWMQLACLYEPNHMLSHHLLPALAISVTAGLVARRFLRLD